MSGPGRAPGEALGGTLGGALGDALGTRAGGAPGGPAAAAPPVLGTPAGDVPLAEYRLGLGGRTWSVLHAGALLSHVDEQLYLGEPRDRLPYGAALWPSSIALAHDVAARADAFRGRAVLELGAGTGLPGIVAASFGARVTQTDKHALALELCAANGRRNGVAGVTYRAADWTAWDDDARYSWILGADVLYAESTQPALRAILERNLAPGGRVLLADPFRKASLPVLEAMEADGWTVAVARWTVHDAALSGETDPMLAPRHVGVFELAPPA